MGHSSKQSLSVAVHSDQAEIARLLFSDTCHEVTNSLRSTPAGRLRSHTDAPLNSCASSASS